MMWLPGSLGISKASTAAAAAVGTARALVLARTTFRVQRQAVVMNHALLQHTSSVSWGATVATG
jgi:ABC-type molybdate transport system permease subunit